METGEASSETLRNAKRVWRFVQSDGYPDEKVTMNRNALTVDEHYTSLPPMVDEHGLLRKYSRIAVADCLEQDSKFPIILPKGHLVTN